MALLHVGAGTIILEIISSFREVSVGGGGHTNDSMISSVVFIKEAKSGGSVREDLEAIEEDSVLECRNII